MKINRWGSSNSKEPSTARRKFRTSFYSKMPCENWKSDSRKYRAIYARLY
jgi:hypothetical protein